jgi:hypothetical protein
MGHSCELLFSDRRDVIQTLRSSVVREEIKRREDSKEPVLERGEMTETFIRNWLIENEAPLKSQLGMEDGPTQKFLTGIFITTSASKAQVPFLQEVIQADGAHMSFGKYTLFSAYATTANGLMAPLGFVILFGNEDTVNWTCFWKFIVSEHPIVNQVTKTVITDQDKGALTAIRQTVPKAGQFHCAFHRHQNIKKKFGGEEGNSPLTCLWMFNLLVKCSSVSSICYLKSLYYPQMRPTHTAYLDALCDDQQYPAACCHKDGDDIPDIYMFGKTASSGVESMNRANEDIQKRTAVDLLKSTIILIKKEGVQFK